MEFGQILVCCMKNRFLGCWRLQTSYRLFYGFVKMTIYQHLAIFNGLHLQFSIVSDSPFQKNEPVEHWYNWLLSNFSRLLNWKEPGTYPSPPNISKDCEKLLPCLIYFNWTSLVSQWVVFQKTYIWNCVLLHVLIMTPRIC